MTRVLRTTPIAALGLAVAMTGCSRGEAAEANGTIELAQIGRRDLEIRAEAAGQIEPIRVIEVKSKASGEILTLSFETGDNVERGTLLATIDPRDVQNAYDQAEADLAVAEARAETSRAQLKRVEEMRAANVVTAQELESAQLDVANQNASLIRARTNLNLARERLNDVRITAPLTGTVIEKTVEIGQIIASATGNVSGGTTLLKMADLAQMQVRSLIDETDLGRIKAGLAVQVTVEAYPDRQFRGQVLKIEPQAVIDQNVTMFPVLVMLDNNEGLLKPGMNADVVIEVATRADVVAVPNSAVVGTQDAVAAGAVLGLSEDQVNESMSARRAPPTPQPAADDESTGGRGAQPAPDAAQQGEGTAADCMALFRQMRESGGAQNLSAEDQAKLETCRTQMQGMAGGRGGRGGGGGRGAQQGDVDQRPGVVFVALADGSYQARRVTLGLNDLDFTEVVRGLDEGEQVVMISAARLLAAQQEFLDRIRNRSTNPMGGATHTPGMGGRGR